MLILRVNLTRRILEAIELFDASHVDVIVGLLANQSLITVVSINTEISSIIALLNPQEHLNNPTRSLPFLDKAENLMNDIGQYVSVYVLQRLFRFFCDSF